MGHPVSAFHEAVEAGTGGVLGDGGVDVEGEREGGAPIFAGDARGGAGADTFEEGFDLEAERLALLDRGLRDMET